jgi:excisionase family DNA binding protein
MTTIDTQTQKSFTPSQVANYLGMKTSSIYALISRGYLQANRSGSRRLITSSQLDHYLMNRGRGDQLIDLTKPRTLLSDNSTLQGLENQVLRIDNEGTQRQWP